MQEAQVKARAYSSAVDALYGELGPVIDSTDAASSTAGGTMMSATGGGGGSAGSMLRHHSVITARL